MGASIVFTEPENYSGQAVAKSKQRRNWRRIVRGVASATLIKRVGTRRKGSDDKSLSKFKPDGWRGGSSIRFSVEETLWKWRGAAWFSTRVPRVRYRSECLCEKAGETERAVEGVQSIALTHFYLFSRNEKPFSKLRLNFKRFVRTRLRFPTSNVEKKKK